MAEKASASGAAGRGPVAGQHDGVRNVVLVGHSGAGKTTLVEALLAAIFWARSAIQRGVAMLGGVWLSSRARLTDQTPIQPTPSILEPLRHKCLLKIFPTTRPTKIRSFSSRSMLAELLRSHQ